MSPYVTSVERFGFQRGLKEGQIKGMREGMRQGLLNGIGLGLELRFGDQGMKLLPRLKKVQDTDTLQQVTDLLRVRDTTLEDLERFIAESGGNGAGGSKS